METTGTIGFNERIRQYSETIHAIHDAFNLPLDYLRGYIACYEETKSSNEEEPIRIKEFKKALEYRFNN